MGRRRLIRTSLHAFAEALLEGKNGPLRGFTVGRILILWDGKPGDYIETISTDELFGEDLVDTEVDHRG